MKENTSSCNHNIVIIGAGLGGLAMAIRLKMQGIHDFIILERSHEIGGTWRDNTYPGCACDIPSYLYSFSFMPNTEWTSTYPEQSEILDYLKKCVATHNLDPHIRYGSVVESLRYDESLKEWQIAILGKSQQTAKLVVIATGPLNRANIPDQPDINMFKGRWFHSSHWPSDLDITNKNVVVIGTGASAIQIVPAICKKVKRLNVFQRTPPWIMPRINRRISSLQKNIFRILPFLQSFLRTLIYWKLEITVFGFKGNKLFQKSAEALAKSHLSKSINDPALRELLTPKYIPGCKRILVSSDYYPALLEKNVTLQTSEIIEIQSDKIITKDQKHIPADIIVYATGFKASNFLSELSITGIGGVTIQEHWKIPGPNAYLGITVSGFPNLCLILGPNTNLGHNSTLHMVESQVNYILDYYKLINNRAGEILILDLKPEVEVRFQKMIQERLEQSVWQQGGCNSWYLTSDKTNTTMWPGSTIEYRRKTKGVELVDFNILE